MNISILVGRITRDPELKALPGDKMVCNFSIAVRRKYQKDKSDFFECVAWGKLGETIATYTAKGREIALQGRFENEEFEKDGQKRRVTKYIVDDIQFIGPKAEGKTSPNNDFVIVTDENLPW